MESILKLTHTCLLPYCNDSFRPNGILDKFCSKECRKKCDSRPHIGSSMFSNFIEWIKKFVYNYNVLVTLFTNCDIYLNSYCSAYGTFEAVKSDIDLGR